MAWRNKPDWNPNEDLDDSALVWRAVQRDRLVKRMGFSFNELFAAMAGAMGGMGIGSGGRAFTGGPAAEGLARAQQSALRDGRDLHRSVARTREGWYQLAALELSNRLDDAERIELRRTGTLPHWFPPELTAKAKELKRRSQRT